MKKSFTLVELVFVIVIVGILTATALAKLTNNSELDLATNQIMQHVRYTQNLALIDDTYTSHAWLNTRYARYYGDTSNWGRMLRGTRQWFKENWQLMFLENADVSGRRILSYAVFSDSGSTSVGSYGSGGLHPDHYQYDGIPKARPAPNVMDKYPPHEVPKDPSLPNLRMAFLPQETNKEVRNEKFNLTDTYGIAQVNFINCGDTNNKKSIMFDFFGKPYMGIKDKDSSFNPYKALVKVQKNCAIEIVHETEGKAYICLEHQTGYIKRADTKEACVAK